MEILINNEIDKDKWNEFTHFHRNSNPFQLYEFYESFKNSDIYTPIAIACQDKGTKVYKGILLAVIQKDKNKVLGFLSRRSTIMGGPLTDNSNKTLDALLSTYNKLIKNKAIYTQFRNFDLFNKNQEAVFNKYGYNFIDHLNIKLELPESKELLWKQIDRSRKKGINKAKLSNFSFSEENYDNVSTDFYNLLVELYRRIRIPCPQKEYFDQLNSKMASNIKVFSLKMDSKSIIILFSLAYNKTLYAYYVGILQDDTILKMKPSDLFFFELLEWCINNQYNIFDWMGAGKPNKEYGVRKFKLEYGGETVNLGRFEKIHNMFLFNIGKFGLQILKKF
jgi:serine/alanine adding enzyme